MGSAQNQRIIVADIGGTNSRFALLEGKPLQLTVRCTVPTDFPSFDHVIEELKYRSPEFFARKADCIVLAVAGAVNNQEEIQLTNRAYGIRRDQLLELSDQVLFINDFEAQAWATMTPLMKSAEPVIEIPGSTELNTDALTKGVLVIGPGTGLGVAYCRLKEGRLFILPTEAGHVALPFAPGVESQYALFLRQELQRDVIEYEDTVCGNGLIRLNHFLSGTRKTAPEITSSPDFSQSDTCRWFARFLARACRNLGLSFIPKGGILITGGVAGRCPELVHNKAFIDEFLSIRAPFDQIIHSIPVWLNRDDSSGLWGSAEAAIELLKHNKSKHHH